MFKFLSSFAGLIYNQAANIGNFIFDQLLANSISAYDMKSDNIIDVSELGKDVTPRDIIDFYYYG